MKCKFENCSQPATDSGLCYSHEMEVLKKAHMLSFTARLSTVGGSFGIVIPKQLLKAKGWKVNDELEVVVRRI